MASLEANHLEFFLKILKGKKKGECMRTVMFPRLMTGSVAFILIGKKHGHCKSLSGGYFSASSALSAI